MSEEQLKAFIEKVKADTSLQEMLKAAADPDAVVSIAKDSGFAITAEDIQSELTDEDLESAAGGADYFSRDGECGKCCTRGACETSRWP